MSIKELVLLIRILVYSVNTHGDRVLHLLKGTSLANVYNINGDTRISNKRVHGEMTLIQRSITGLYSKTQLLAIEGENS